MSQATRAHDGQVKGTARKLRLRLARRAGPAALAAARKPGWQPLTLRPKTADEIRWEKWAGGDDDAYHVR